jgi:hypothetical protein
MIMRCFLASLLLALVLIMTACSAANDNAHTTATTNVTPSPTQILTVVPRPKSVDDLALKYAVDGDDNLVLKILSPTPDAVVNNPVLVNLGVDKKIDGPMRYASGQPLPAVEAPVDFWVAVTLDGKLCQPHMEPRGFLELRNLQPGQHTLHAFILRATGESYKNPEAFQAVNFSVGGSDLRPQPTQNPDSAKRAHYQCEGSAARLPPINLSEPGLIVNWPSPLVELRDPIMLDFWLVNAKLKGDGGEHRVRYFIDDDDARYIDKWKPIWLSGWIPGKHSVRVELLGADQYPVPNGITTQEITVIK